jgi:hypothetical protein
VPTPVHAQLGELVVPCAGTYVSILTQSEVPLDPDAKCGAILMADIVAVIARECANVANDDGTTNWVAQDAVSVMLDVDGDLLWDWAEKQRAVAWYRQGTPAIVYTVQGAIAMTTLTVPLPVP